MPFSQLQADVNDLINRSDLGKAYPMLLRLAQSKLEGTYLPRFLRVVTNLQFSGSTFLFPQDMLRISAVRVWDGAMNYALDEVPESRGRELLRSLPATPSATATTNIPGGSGFAVYWRESGGLGRVVFQPTPTAYIELDYYKKAALLVNASDTNEWLQYAYEILLYAVAAEAALYLVDGERATLFQQEWRQRLRDLQRTDVADEVSGRTALIKGGLNA